MNMNPILCVTEFTELTLDAARVATACARRWGEHVVLVRSVDERGQFPFPLRTRLVQHDWRRLAGEAARLRQLGFDFEEEVLRGIPEDGIAAFGWNAHARLIVVGCRPTRGLELWALGCLAEEIAARSLVPVLAVRSAAPFERWFEGGAPLNVYVGIDPAARPEAILYRLDELRALGSCAMSAGLVAYPEINHSRPEAAPAGLREHEFRPGRDATEAGWTEFAARNIAVSHVDSAGRAEAALVERASAAQADLLVITSRPHTEPELLPHRCLARGVLRRAPMSVLCVPEADLEPPRIAAEAQRAGAREAGEFHPTAAPPDPRHRVAGDQGRS